MKKQTNEGLSNVHKINENDRIEKDIWYGKEPIKNPKNRKQIVKKKKVNEKMNPKLETTEEKIS